MTERELQYQVELMCRQLGLYHYHTHDSRRSQAGFPDSFIASRRTGQVMYRELKSGNGHLTSEQVQVGYILTAGGHDYAVWRPRDLFEGTIGRQLAALAGIVAVAS